GGWGEGRVRGAGGQHPARGGAADGAGPRRGGGGGGCEPPIRAVPFDGVGEVGYPLFAGLSRGFSSMATMITSECINCGACEPECPNTAIYQGAVEWQAPDGSMHPALSNEIFYTVPARCTECVGFHDHEACAAVCPVDCCVPNPNIPETHDVLLARARQLHPEETIPDDAPSRFKKGGGEAAPPAAAPAAAPT